jgi:hypothetical protein
MAEWIYFLHPPRDNFAETMTDEERAAFGRPSRGGSETSPLMLV